MKADVVADYSASSRSLVYGASLLETTQKVVHSYRTCRLIGKFVLFAVKPWSHLLGKTVPEQDFGAAGIINMIRYGEEKFFRAIRTVREVFMSINGRQSRACGHFSWLKAKLMQSRTEISRG